MPPPGGLFISLASDLASSHMVTMEDAMRTITTPPIELWRMPRVMAATGLARAHIYKLVKDGNFPRPVKITARCSAWRSDLVQGWIAERIAAYDSTQAAA